MSEARVWGQGAVVACALALELLVLAWPETTRHDGWIRRDTSGEIAGETVLTQSFHVVGSNLRAIRFYARLFGAASAGTAHLRLDDVRADPPRLVHERLVPVAEVVAVDRFQYQFPSVRSSNREYQLTISVPDAPAGQGITVDILRRAYGDPRTDALSYAGHRRFGSLRFEADVDTTTLIGRLFARVDSERFGGLKVLAVVLAWVVFHLFLVQTLVAARRTFAA